MVLYNTIPNLGEFTKIPLSLFFAMGVVVFRWTPNEKTKRWQYIFLLFFIFNFLIDIGGMLAYLLFESLETSLEKTAYLIYSTFAGSSMIKIFCCFYNRQKVRKILTNFQMYYPRTLRERKNYEFDEHLQSIHRYNKGLTIYHFCVTSMFNLFPLMQCIILYYQGGKSLFLYKLPFPLVYIFDVKNAWGYAFAYLTQCTGAYEASCAFLGSDLLLITCVHLVNMNFKYLAKSIRDFKPSGTKSDYEKLKGFIAHHSDILNTIQLIDETFNISIFLNFMGTATIICLIGFQLLVGTDFLDLIKFLSFLISILTHVYFISIFGTKMMTLSSEVSDAFMHHPWYDANIEYRRALILAIRRAQKPAHLNAFKFFIVSMETFKSLVSVSYQFFTLLKTSYEDE